MNVKQNNLSNKSKSKQCILTAITVVVGVVICALAMHFLSSPERWIRL